jgi:hypothetical protein
MQLRTYTGLWQVEKRIYKFYDVNLPYPVTVKQIVLFFGSLLPWMFLMGAIGVPFAPPFGHVVWLAPPILIAWFANKPVAEGKNLFEYLLSQVSFLFARRHYAALVPVDRKGKSVAMRGSLWSTSPSNSEQVSASGKGDA